MIIKKVKSSINSYIETKLSILRCLIKIVILFTLIAYNTWSSNNYYPPQIHSFISSEINIGVEATGYHEVIIQQKTKDSTSMSRNIRNKKEDNTIQKETHSKERKTNDNKFKSRPKASGLIGGIGRAFAGDYSGLLDWGGKFIDHMMEPKYIWTSSNIYSTEKKNTKYYLNNQEWHASNISNYTNELEKRYKEDINKGFIEFTVTVVNNGKNTVRIKKPVFVVNFVNDQGKRFHSKQVNGYTSLEEQKEYPIPGGGGKYHFTVKANNLNVLNLFQIHNKSSGVEAIMQNVEIKNDAGTFSTISEIIEKKLNSGIYFEIYNGNENVVKFIDLVGKTPTIDELLKKVIGEDFCVFNSSSIENHTLDNYILEINGLKNNFDDIPLEKANGDTLIKWRHWFVTIANADGQLLPFKVGSKIKPGYSVILGYYGGKEILGENYQPIVYLKENQKIFANKEILIDKELYEGDIIKISNMKFKKIFIDKLNYEVKSTRRVTGKSFKQLIRPIFDKSSKVKITSYQDIELQRRQYESLRSQNTPKNFTKLKLKDLEVIEVPFDSIINITDIKISQNFKKTSISYINQSVASNIFSLLQNPFYPEFNNKSDIEAIQNSISSGIPMMANFRFSPEAIRSTEPIIYNTELKKAFEEEISPIYIHINKFIPRNKNKWIIPLQRRSYSSLEIIHDSNAFDIIGNEYKILQKSIGQLGVDISISSTSLFSIGYGMLNTGREDYIPRLNSNNMIPPFNSELYNRNLQSYLQMRGLSDIVGAYLFVFNENNADFVDSEHGIFELSADIAVIRR